MKTNTILVAIVVLGLPLTAVAQAPAGQTTPTGQPPSVSPVPQSPPGQQGAGGPPARSAPVPQALVVDIYALIERLADEMDKEFILDPRMGGMTFLSTAGANANYDTLLAVLRNNNYAAVEDDNQVRIVPDAVARSEPTPIVNEDDSRISNHAVVTRVIDVSGIEFDLPGVTPDEAGSVGPQLVPVLRPMMSTAIGNMAIIPGTNKLILTDRYDNIRRITAIIDALR